MAAAAAPAAVVGCCGSAAAAVAAARVLNPKSWVDHIHGVYSSAKFCSKVCSKLRLKVSLTSLLNSLLKGLLEPSPPSKLLARTLPPGETSPRGLFV